MKFLRIMNFFKQQLQSMRVVDGILAPHFPSPKHTQVLVEMCHDLQTRLNIDQYAMYVRYYLASNNLS